MTEIIKNKKLLLIGPSTGSVHLENYFRLIEGVFKEVKVVSSQKVDYADSVVANFSLKNPFRFLREVKKIRRVIADYKPDVIHVHQANSCALMVVMANKKAKIPLVLTCWGSDVLVLPKKSLILKKIAIKSLNGADVLTVDAREMERAIKELGVDKKILWANFGIELDAQFELQKENIIYSNRLHKPLYNIDQIILGAADFLNANSDWKIVFAANGPLTNELELMAKEIISEDQFEFVGFVDQIRNKEYYAKSKIWVSIPSSDGTAISLLEAMAYGCVPVVSDLPASREWVKDDKNGVVDKENLSESFTKAISLNLQEVIRYNQELVLKHGTKKSNRQKFIQLYRELLG